MIYYFFFLVRLVSNSAGTSRRVSTTWWTATPSRRSPDTTWLVWYPSPDTTWLSLVSVTGYNMGLTCHPSQDTTWSELVSRYHMVITRLQIPHGKYPSPDTTWLVCYPSPDTTWVTEHRQLPVDEYHNIVRLVPVTRDQMVSTLYRIPHGHFSSPDTTW